MKLLKSYIIGVMALTAAAALPACQDHFDEPSDIENIPVATLTPNTTIAEVKEYLWSNDNNYCETVYTLDYYKTPEAERTDELKTRGDHVIIAGRVVSSDYAGNVFKYLVLQDETGSLNFSINSYNLYLNYRVGQEVVVDLTGLHMGKYRGLEQVGFPSYNSSIPGYETSFMAPELFASHAQLNGLPNVAAVDTIEVERFSDLGVTPVELRKWQSSLVRFNNVEFVPNTTVPTLSTYHSSGVTQQIRDAEGNTLDIRTSGYANFWNMELPADKCDVVALLGYYLNLGGSGGWQLTLLDANSILNVGDPTVPKGSEANPYDVREAIAYQVNSANRSGWVAGYIVGTVGPEVETVASSADIEWTATPTLGNTIVIGQTADTKDIAQCLVITLPQGSDLRTYGALRENPDNYGKPISVKGTFAEVMGTFGVTGNNGTSAEFTIDGKHLGDTEPTLGDGTEDNPYSCAQIIAMAPSSTTVAVESGVWAQGYIVGYYENYAAHFETSTSQRANILLSDTPSPAGDAQCICVQLVAQTDVRNALNLVDNPGMLGAKVAVQGDVMKYNSLPGIKATSNYKSEGGGVTPPTPPAEAVTSLDENFATAIPTTWTQVQVAGNKTWYQRTFDEVSYASMTGYNGTAPFDQWLVSPAVNMDGVSDKHLSFRTQVNGYGSTTSRFEVYVMTQADTKGTNTKLSPTIATAPASGYSTWTESGSLDLSAYSGTVYIGFRYYATQDANYATWCVTDIKLGVGGGSTEPVDPPTPPAGSYKGDFNSFNDGQAKSTYGTYTNATGWTAENCNILSGLAAGESDQNPRFGFIGDATTLAVTLNGNTTKVGKLTSPTLTGGCGTLTFNYGFAYSETKCAFTVNIIQNGAVVKTRTVTLDTIEQKHAYDFSMDVNVTGSFSIEIVNDCISAATTNKDRVSIWNLTWTE